jgi:predicted house-cleaning noncanonical NTP pyrophosphatase (MazG superfamily)
MHKIKTYNKLVRDKIPEIIESNGQHCEIKTLNDEEYIQCLEAKLNEEVGEYQESKDAEEIADILEVLMATAKARGYSWQEILRIQLNKRTERGGFNDKIFLISTEE